MKLRFVVTERVQEKLTNKHNVTRSEVVQCFANKVGKLLEDPREEHKTDPPTQWFIAETDSSRTLKIIFIRENDVVFLKSAYEPDQIELAIYKKYGM
jgi:hypothetical protein